MRCISCGCLEHEKADSNEEVLGDEIGFKKIRKQKAGR